MNSYRYVFAATCPSDGDAIIYGLEIRSKEMIRVEAIKDACAEWPRGFQEEIAADLHGRFGCEVRLRAQHQGVEILTVLGDKPESNNQWLDTSVGGMAGTPGILNHDRSNDISPIVPKPWRLTHR